MLAGYPESGLTQKVYARRDWINNHTFVAWLGQARHGRGESARRSGPGGRPNVQARFAEVSLGASFQTLEVRLPDGMIVRGDDPEVLLCLIRGLRS